MDILARARKLEAQGRSIIHMEIGEPDFPTPEPIIEAGIQSLKQNKTHYTASTGLPELRTAISGDYAHRFGVEVDAEQIIITPGASGALQTLLAYLNGGGNRLMIGDPTYPCNRTLTQVYHGECLMVPVEIEDHYQLSLARVQEYWDDRINAVLIASPANPTGTLCDTCELLAIADYLQQHSACLIVDEIYQGLVYDHENQTVAGLRDNIFVINSFSKYFGMMGWRLGWLVCPQNHYAALDAMAQNTYLAPSTPAQYAAYAAFDERCFEIYEQRKREFQKRRDFLIEKLSQIGCEFPVIPQGAFYLYVDVSRWCRNSFEFCQDLLEKTGVAITPGCDFGYYRANQHVRLAYTTGIDQLQEACVRLATYMDELAPLV
ncbi:MAG TPA: aminotransferase class I/II-fold pyridoxal phosphate-dependent enzyme [Methylotenera sp.]|nr:aminotransferase class I/II-fold pyridoxal phosphate-dependent enzyme [Methylotenera sp.]